MDYKKLLWTIGLVLLILVACSAPQPTAPPPTATALPTATQEPTATPAPPTVTPTTEVLEWDYVALGDYVVSMPGDFSYATHYAAYIEADLGVKVNLYNAGGSYHELSSVLLDRLQTDQALREKISEAKIVTLGIGGADIGWVLMNEYRTEQCGGDDNMDCIRETLTSFKTNYAAIFTELFKLCRSGTIIRTMTYYHASMERVNFTGDPQPFIALLNEQILQVASDYNVPVSKVYEVFNGPYGDEDAAAKGYVTNKDTVTLAPGAIKIAEIHRDLGYEPTIP